MFEFQNVSSILRSIWNRVLWGVTYLDDSLSIW